MKIGKSSFENSKLKINKSRSNKDNTKLLRELRMKKT